MQKILHSFSGKRVLVTGHTGFKGSWLCELLLCAGAQVVGYALPEEKGELFDLLNLKERMYSVEGDVRDLSSLQRLFEEVQPEIVFHLAAQPIVREGYRNPVDTYAVNVMGTVHVMECVRMSDSVRSVVNITTDKVYQNQEWIWGYRENERLNGADPYSNSKSCSELVTDSYIRSFLMNRNVAVSTARAGNVIGGGDFAKDRIIPDCVRAAAQKNPVVLRNPNAVRPYQHVLEALSAYLCIAWAQFENPSMSGAYNVGPEPGDCLTTGELADCFCRCWGPDASWVSIPDGGPREASLLRLDCSLISAKFGWHPRWNAAQAVEQTVAWSKALYAGEDMQKTTVKQILEYFS